MYIDCLNCLNELGVVFRWVLSGVRMNLSGGSNFRSVRLTEVIVGVIHYFLAIVVFLSWFLLVAFLLPCSLKKDPIAFFHEHVVYGGKLDLFPHQLLVNGGVCHIETGGGCVECDGGFGVAYDLCFWWCSSMCLV